jgi:hypothetical protein
LKTLKGPHTRRIHLQNMDNQARQIYAQPNPSNAGTKHLKK